MTAGANISWPIRPMAVAYAIVQHAALDGDDRESHRSCLAASAGAPVDSCGSVAASILHATRRGGTEHGAANLPTGHCAKPMCQLPRG